MPKVVNQEFKDDYLYPEGTVISSNRTASFDDSDEKLVATANKWREDGESLIGGLKEKMKKNEDYYLGNQLKDKKLGDYKAKIVDNKIFQNLETLVPVAAANLPAPVVTLPASDDDAEQVDFQASARMIEDMIYAIAQEGQLDAKLRECVRLHQINYLYALHYEYEEDEGTICFEVCNPRSFLLPPNCMEDWVIQRKMETVEEIKEHMDEEGVKKLAAAFGKETLDDNALLSYIKVWTPEFSFCKAKDVIWDKRMNPNWDSTKGSKKNLWRKPKVPFIFSDIWTLGKNKYSQTTLIDQTISIQDAINKRERQISDNADHANGLLVGYGGGEVTKEELAEAERKREKPNGVIFTEKGVQGSMANLNGRNLDPYVFQDLQNLLAQMDNIWGTHSNLRGEKTPGEITNGGQQLLKTGDESRIGEIGKMLDRTAEELYNAIAQLIRIHFKEPHLVSYLGEDGASKQIKIDANTIADGVKIRVRKGSTLRKDKSAMAAQAIQLWSQKALDPISLFEALDVDNPIKSAERFMMYTIAPQNYMPTVKKAYDEATKGDEQQAVLISIQQADVENRYLAMGQAVAPNPKATIQHVLTHYELMKSPEFAKLPPEVQLNFKAHLEPELAIVKTRSEEMEEARNKQNLERVESLTGLIMGA